MKSTDVLERWKISKLINLLENGKFTKLPHQRPLMLKKDSSKRFIDSTLNNKLLQNFIFSDLESSYNSSQNKNDKDFFNEYLKKGKEYSIEDCQHRMASLQLVTDEDFVGEFEGRMDEFYGSEVPVLVLMNRTREELISDFGEVNSGKTVTNDNLMWGIDNKFNNFIKNKFISDERLLRLYKTKKKSDYVKRILYGNILKIVKVCSSYDGFIESPNTGAESMMSFIKNDMMVTIFVDIINLFDLWYDFIKEKPSKDSFTTQSDLFFIVHILNNRNVELSQERVDSILSKLTDTRSSAEKRYINILNLITNEG
jgi:hypothetical protein